MLRGSAGSVESGFEVGSLIAECAKAGRDKLTLISGRPIASLGLWIEQLIAESTGKEGKGILPVAGEPLGAPAVYGSDRVFVSISTGEISDAAKAELDQLVAAGHPVVYRELDDLDDLAGEFFLWEFATACAGWRLGINPFDQPNVQESKDVTKELLTTFVSEGRLPEQEELVGDDVLKVFVDGRAREVLPATSVLDALRAHLATVEAGDYVAFLNYIEETPEIDSILQRIRTHVRDETNCATTIGYGPRFLHSTGQLHKGGPDTGVFLQITARDQVDLDVPGEPYTFSTLKAAQALGDFRALIGRGRRAIRVDLGNNGLVGLKRLEELVFAAIPSVNAANP